MTRGIADEIYTPNIPNKLPRKRQPQCGTCVQKTVCEKYKVKLGSDDCLNLIKKARNLDYKPLQNDQDQLVIL